MSCDPNDPGFHPGHHAARVWLAGSQRCNVITADEEARFALVLRLDEHGRPVVGEDGQPIVDPFYGDVRVEFRSGP